MADRPLVALEDDAGTKGILGWSSFVAALNSADPDGAPGALVPADLAGPSPDDAALAEAGTWANLHQGLRASLAPNGLDDLEPYQRWAGSSPGSASLCDTPRNTSAELLSSVSTNLRAISASGPAISSATKPTRRPQWYALWLLLFLNVTAGISIVSHASGMTQTRPPRWRRGWPPSLEAWCPEAWCLGGAAAAGPPGTRGGSCPMLQAEREVVPSADVPAAAPTALWRV